MLSFPKESLRGDLVRCNRCGDEIESHFSVSSVSSVATKCKSLGSRNSGATFADLNAYKGRAMAKSCVANGIGLPAECFFVCGTTEGINLVASSWGRTNLTDGSCRSAGALSLRNLRGMLETSESYKCLTRWRERPSSRAQAGAKWLAR